MTESTQTDPTVRARWQRSNRLWNGFFFLVATAAASWLLFVTLQHLSSVHWAFLLWLVILWVGLAYLILPRIHRILTTLYVPDYFIGRARTADGLLGDPINLAFDGTAAAIEAALAESGWTKADPITFASSWKIIVATLTRRPYSQAPVSPLFLFGKQQDFAYQQEVHGSPAKRHHIRLWKCPPGWPLPGGQSVEWLAAATFDKRVGLSLFTLQVTHKIASDTDAERDHVLQTLKNANPKVRVRVLERYSTAYHARNGGGDAIETDGNLPIVSLTSLTERDPEVQSELIDNRQLQRPPALYLAMFIVFLQTLPPLYLAISSTWEEHSVPWAQLAATTLIVFLAVGLWVGMRSARLLLMASATLSILSAMELWWHSHTYLQGASSLISVSLSVALLLAVSSQSVSQFADWRADKRAQRSPDGKR